MPPPPHSSTKQNPPPKKNPNNWTPQKTSSPLSKQTSIPPKTKEKTTNRTEPLQKIQNTQPNPKQKRQQPKNPTTSQKKQYPKAPSKTDVVLGNSTQDTQEEGKRLVQFLQSAKSGNWGHGQVHLFHGWRWCLACPEPCCSGAGVGMVSCVSSRHLRQDKALGTCSVLSMMLLKYPVYTWWVGCCQGPSGGLVVLVLMRWSILLFPCWKPLSWDKISLKKNR